MMKRRLSALMLGVICFFGIAGVAGGDTVLAGCRAGPCPVSPVGSVAASETLIGSDLRPVGGELELARNALAASPLAQAALVRLAHERLAKGSGRSGVRILHLAGGLGWRGAWVQTALYKTAVDEGDCTEAVRRGIALIRQNRLRDELFPRLAGEAARPECATALRNGNYRRDRWAHGWLLSYARQMPDAGLFAIVEAGVQAGFKRGIMIAVMKDLLRTGRRDAAVKVCSLLDESLGGCRSWRRSHGVIALPVGEGASSGGGPFDWVSGRSKHSWLPAGASVTRRLPVGPGSYDLVAAAAVSGWMMHVSCTDPATTKGQLQPLASPARIAVECTAPWLTIVRDTGIEGTIPTMPKFELRGVG